MNSLADAGRFWTTALLTLLIALAGLAPEGQAQDQQEQPLFVFAAIGDSHMGVGGTSDSKYIKAGDKSAKLLGNYVRDINSHVPRIDFAVHLGDVTDKGREPEFKLAREIMDSLACPYFPVVGNHDNFQSDAKRAWREFARRDSTTYAFDCQGFHFIVIDCTKDPYTVDGVDCNRAVREWVQRDLAAHRDAHVIVFSHYNMLERDWNPEFDTTRHYAEYNGMRQMRRILEEAGNVVAVVNGHVHANRVEVHGGVRYIDVGATLVGRPSVRYFAVFPDRITVTYAYISDRALLDYVAALGGRCTTCFDSSKVVDFVDGTEADKQFTIPLEVTSQTSR